MKNMCRTGARTAVAILSLAACFCGAIAHGADNVVSPSAEEAVRGALENVRARYRGKLSRYGLTESYFDETCGICDLMLLDIRTWTKYQIVYYRATGQIEIPRTMPGFLARDLMQDRLVIHQYECALDKGKSKSSAAKGTTLENEQEDPSPQQQEYKPLNKEDEFTPEEKAAIEETLRNARQAEKAGAARKKKGDLNQKSDFRQMEALMRRGMSGDEIAIRFGIDRVKEYNAAHPKNQIKTSKHSKSGASGFAW